MPHPSLLFSEPTLERVKGDTETKAKGGPASKHYALGWVEMFRSAEIVLSHPKVDVIHKNNHTLLKKFFI